MKYTCIVLYVCLAFLLVLLAGCNSPAGEEITFDQLMANPARYSERDITVEAFYFHGFEVIVLCKSLKYSGYAEGHLIPEGELVWVEGGIPVEVYNNLNRQQMMGPNERYGNVRMRGKFHYGGRYGHLDGYMYQITPAEVALLPWSPR